MRLLSTALCALPFLAAATLVQAQPQEVIADESQSVPSFGIISFYFENDLFGGKDQQYTNGARISLLSPNLVKYGDDPNLGRLAGAFDDFRWIGAPGYERNVAFTIGQNMYTPNDTESVDLVEDDRPYAGWLYAGLGLVWKNEKVRNTFLVNVGVVGPWSYAEETQRLVHEARGIEVPEGWGNQIDNELGIVLAYERMWRLRDAGNGWGWDVLPYAGASVGNVYTFAKVGAELRLGYNLPDDFGTSAIGPSATTSTPVEAPGRAKRWYNSFGTHLFARAEGRAVARDIFLDGNTFEDSHSVDKEPLVADLVAGVSVNYRNTKLTYAYIYRTKEFKGQEDEQIFGSLTLTVNF
jgi:hypothetical protein